MVCAREDLPRLTISSPGLRWQGTEQAPMWSLWIEMTDFVKEKPVRLAMGKG